MQHEIISDEIANYQSR